MQKFQYLFSLAGGLLLAILSLEIFGGLLIAVNWWSHRDGLTLATSDFNAAIAVVFSLLLAPALTLLAFFSLNRRATTGTPVFLATLAIAIRLVLLGLPFVVGTPPWTLEILSGKWADIFVATFATAI